MHEVLKILNTKARNELVHILTQNINIIILFLNYKEKMAGKKNQ